MNTRLYYLIAVITVLFCLTSFAIDKRSKYYGKTHKLIFNKEENCINCHLYDEDVYKEIEGKSSSDVPPQGIDEMSDKKGSVQASDDDYDYEEEGDEDDEEGSLNWGWFFGKKKEKKKPFSSYINDSYKLSGFANKEYVMPHEFSKSITGICMSGKCHTKEELGMSHAVEVSPYKTYPNMKVPEDIPLNWDTAKYKEVITCGSCHNPHIDWLSATKSYKHQRPHKKIKGRKYYKTNYLRIQDPDKGYYTLCRGCHGESY